jgi:galactose mutarotase-like enzyme
MTEHHRIANDHLSAVVKRHGAELCSLSDAGGREFLWQAGPAWPRHAPVLFPIVGRLAGDRLRHGGQTYTLTQHGFARESDFTWRDRAPDACLLSLTDDATTRAVFPFAFRLEIGYRLHEASLAITFMVVNPAETVLPASVGAHPAFCWPLDPAVPKTAHALTFGAPEPASVRRLSGGLLDPTRFPTPIEGRVLALDETLFAADALILDQPASRSLRYGAPGTPAISVTWEGFRELGLWMKPGADFLCIEPWYGTASPLGWDGEFGEKPGIMRVEPLESQSAVMTIGLA